METSRQESDERFEYQIVHTKASMQWKRTLHGRKTPPTSTLIKHVYATCNVLHNPVHSFNLLQQSVQYREHSHLTNPDPVTAEQSCMLQCRFVTSSNFRTLQVCDVVKTSQDRNSHVPAESLPWSLLPANPSCLQTRAVKPRRVSAREVSEARSLYREVIAS